MGRLTIDPFKDVHSNLLHPLFLALKPDGSMVSRVLDRRLSDLDPTRFEPCRASPNYEQRRHYCGKYPFGPARVLVGFESLVELTCLMELDHDGEAVAIVDQPFCLQFPDGTAHYPDFAAVLASGGGKLVVDVKPAEHATSESFVHAAVLTENVCRAQGWGYRVMHGCTGWAADNLEWMCAVRYGGFAPPVGQADDLAGFPDIPHTMAEAAIHRDARAGTGNNYRQRRRNARLRKPDRVDCSSLNDASSSGPSSVPLLVVANFAHRERMPLSMLYPLPNRIFNLRAFLPGSEAQISSLASAVRVKTSTGQPGLASLTIMIDKSGRSIPATSVHAQDSKPDIANLIAQALAPPAARPVGKLLSHGELQRMNFPWPALLNDAAHAAAAARRPPVRPSRILVEDEDYRSRRLCRKLGITLVTTPKTLWAYAIVERAFTIIQKQFVDKLPGQSVIGYRSRDSGDEDLILIEDLAILFDRWAVQVWPYVRGDY